MESAVKDLQALPSHVQRRFQAAMERIQTNPFRARPGVGVKPLHGGTWHLRIGEYRGIYEVQGKVVTFTRFGHRSTVYR